MIICRLSAAPLGLLAALALVAVGLPTAPPAAAEDLFTTPLPIPAELTDPDITLTAQPADLQILPGAPTRMWTFNGSFPGPTIRRPAGAETRVTVRHDLPEEVGTLTVHNHGNHSAAEHDGTILNPIEPGGEHTYVYDLMEDGAPAPGKLQWYHDHTHHKTGRNVWMGLAGMFIVEDEIESSLPLPKGEYDVPLMITERQFDEDNQLLDRFSAPDRPDDPPASGLLPGSGYPPGDEVAGIGNRVLVNGAPEPYFEVAARKYRLRILNASNFTPYNVRLSDGRPLVQIATEGGLLPEPIERDEILLGPAERAEVIVDFAGMVGQDLELESVPRSDNRPINYTQAKSTPIMQFRVTATAEDDSAIPAQLKPLPGWAADASEDPDRIFAFGLNPATDGNMAWTINGRAFDHDRVDARPEINTTETWMLVNTSPPGFSHYIHLHHTDWKVVSRNGAPPPPGEDALKETFRLDPGEVLVVAATFSDHTGPFMMHCHMLEHEDHGMMVRFDVMPEGEGSVLPDPLSVLAGASATAVSQVLDQLDGSGHPADTSESGLDLTAPAAPAGPFCRLDYLRGLGAAVTQ